MIFPVELDRDRVRSEASLVLDGVVEFTISDIIPGVEPRLPGKYVHLSESYLVCGTGLGQQFHRSASNIGFWCLPDSFDCRPGQRIICCLVLHHGIHHEILLMPFPCSRDSVIDAETGEPLLASTTVEQRIDAMPIQYGIFDDPLPAPILSYNPDIDLARFTWDAVSQRVDSQREEFTLLDDFPTRANFKARGHGYINFVASIPPISVNAPQPLAINYFNENHNQRYRSDFGGKIYVNASYKWSRPGHVPQSDEFDFVSVMLHEMGHALGLGHLNGHRQNVMYESISIGTQKRILQPDDINFLTNIYGLQQK